ncbi:hypothetical protein [uncultured Shewanella sp.]|uniref:hypothetical protein n=1 Tax=uncultured Shewanella sp. TaxID=173975 RepID=UPI002630F0F8|nr:hypothetical protein [uncultured Shewanella sp.]
MRIFHHFVIVLMLLAPSMAVFASSETQKGKNSHNQRGSNQYKQSDHKMNSHHHSAQHKNQYVYNRAYYKNRYHQPYYNRSGSRVGWSIGIGSSWNNGWYPYGGYYGSRWGTGWGYPWNRTGYYGASRYFPFGWNQPVMRPSQPKVISPPQQITTSVEYSNGLTRLPDNAKVIQTSKGTQYEWQGVIYRYDWLTQTYQTVNDKQ